MPGVQHLNTALVDGLVARGYIRSSSVERAFRAVLRHHFLPETPLNTVYRDEAIVTKRGPNGLALSSSSQPAIVAQMLEQLDAREGHHVLEIGAGSGYNAALLGSIVGASGRVLTLDIDADVAESAHAGLVRAGLTNVDVRTSDGWPGAPDLAPFDRIEVTVGAWDISPHWVEQLRPGGMLVVPLWLRLGLQLSIAFARRADRLVSASVEPCGFMRLRGAHAGPEAYVQVEGWQVMLDDRSPEVVASLHSLLAQAPRREPAPHLAAGILTRLALEEEQAVRLWHESDRRHATGLLDMERAGLALLEGGVSPDATPQVDQLVVYGDATVLERLRARVDKLSPLDLRGLDVEVGPPAGAPAAGAIAVLHRPQHVFVVRQGNL